VGIAIGLTLWKGGKMTPNDAVQKLRRDVLEIESIMDAITELIDANRELAGQVIDLKRERDEARRMVVDSFVNRNLEDRYFDIAKTWPEWFAS
jgi:hypothetical protein